MLMRCYKMYEAREATMRILRLLERREKMRVKVRHDNFGDLLAVSSRVLKKILHLQDDHLTLKRPFVFKALEYCAHLVKDTNQLGVELRACGGFSDIQGFGVLMPDAGIQRQ